MSLQKIIRVSQRRKQEIGAFESGLAAKLMRLIPSVIFGGTMTLIIVGFTSKVAPKLKNLNIKED